MRARCSSMMDTFFSVVDRLLCSSSWTEVAGGAGSPPSVKECYLPNPGALKVSRTVSGCGPDLRLPPPSMFMGTVAPVYPAPKVCPPWSRSCWDDTSVSCPVFGEGASGGGSLSRASELSESSDEDCPARDLAELHKVWRQLNYCNLVIPGA